MNRNIILYIVLGAWTKADGMAILAKGLSKLHVMRMNDINDLSPWTVEEILVHTLYIF